MNAQDKASLTDVLKRLKINEKVFLYHTPADIREIAKTLKLKVRLSCCLGKSAYVTRISSKAFQKLTADL